MALFVHITPLTASGAGCIKKSSKLTIVSGNIDQSRFACTCTMTKDCFLVARFYAYQHTRKNLNQFRYV